MAKSTKFLSSRRKKIKARSFLAFAVTRNASGEPKELTVFSGRRSLSRAISPELAAMLVQALSPEIQ